MWPSYNSPGAVSSGEPERVLDNAANTEACLLILYDDLCCFFLLRSANIARISDDCGNSQTDLYFF